MLIPKSKFAPYFKPYYNNRTLSICRYTFGAPFFSISLIKGFTQIVTRVNYVIKT